MSRIWARKGTRPRVVRQRQFLSTYIFGAVCPDSPELNPMEQVWQQLRRIKLSNACFKNYDHIVNTCCEAWNTFCDQEGRIKKLCTRSWAKQQDESSL